jgi:plastocyanin
MASFSTFFSTFAVLFITLSAAVSAATITVDNWYIPYDGPKTVAANVGDTITFEWNIGHNVYIHPTMDCELDGEIFVGEISPTSYTFTEADGGTDMFFACDIGSGGHCKNGKCSSRLILTCSFICKERHCAVYNNISILHTHAPK